MKDKYPKAWADFEKWFKDQDYGKVFDWTSINFFQNIMPFEMQLGVYLKYLNEKKISLRTTYISDDGKEMVEQAFKIREEQL